MIENLLLQQVLLYTREQANPSRQHRSRSSGRNALWVRQDTKLSKSANNEHLVLTSPKSKHDYDEEATLCLIESKQENSSRLIESILSQYNQRKDRFTRFDQNLIDLILKRNNQRKDSSTSTNDGYHFRLQWLAIGLVIDRFFFFIYFTATLVSYFVTLWLIPFSHPNLTIDIHRL
jgi:hypothetical protein